MTLQEFNTLLESGVVTISRELSTLDKLVYLTIQDMYERGKREFTAEEVCRELVRRPDYTGELEEDE